MKVSKDIQNKMRRVVKLHKEADNLMQEIDEYFESKLLSSEKFNNEGLSVARCGNGISLEELEYGNDITDEFVAWAERDFE